MSSIRISISTLLFAACLPLFAQVQAGQQYHGLLCTGQSLSTGHQGWAAGQVTSGTPYSNLSLSPGSLFLGSGGTAAQRDVLPLIALAPWFSTTNSGGDSTNPTSQPEEFPCLAAANQLTYLTGGATGLRYIIGLHGVNGSAYVNGVNGIAGPTDLAQPSGTPAFADGLTQLAAMKSGAVAAGSTFQLDAVVLTHGETDESRRNRTYDVNLTHFQWDYEQQSNALIGRSGLLPMFINQHSDWPTGTVPVVAIKQWQMAENNPGRFFLTGPDYYLPSGAGNDGAHKSPAGYRTLGETYGKVMYQVLAQHKAWTPLMPKRISVSGSTITAVFFVPVGNLQFDNATVAAMPNSGFEFTDGLTAWVDHIAQASGPAPVSPAIYSGGSGYSSAPTVTSTCGTYTANLTGGAVTSLTRTAAGAGCTTVDITFSPPTPSVSISSVSITASDTVQIVLSGPPTGPSPSLRYAYTALAGATTGGRGNLKDTDPVAGRTGSNLSDWCVTFDALLPFTSKLLNVKDAGTAGVSLSGGVVQ